MPQELKPNYKKIIHLREEDLQLIEEFESNINRDFRIERLCEKNKKQRFSVAVRWLIRGYNNLIKNKGFPVRV